MASSNPWRPAQPKNAGAPVPPIVPPPPPSPELSSPPGSAWKTVDVGGPGAAPVTSVTTSPYAPSNLHDTPTQHDGNAHAAPHPVMALPTFADERGGPPPPSRGSRGWIVVLLILVALGALIFWQLPRIEGFFLAKSGQKPDRPVQVVGAKVTRGNLPVYLANYGTVVPLATVTLHSRVDGQVSLINFREGDLVKQGALVIQLDPRPYQVQKQQAVAQMDKDVSALNNAKKDLQRYENSRPAIPQQQVDTQQALVDQDTAAVEVDKAAINSAELNLIYCRITAPISGIIGLRNVDVGNIVHASDTTGMATITPMDPITVIFAVSQKYIPQIQDAIGEAARGAPELTAPLPAASVLPMETPLISPIIAPVTPAATNPSASATQSIAAPPLPATVPSMVLPIVPPHEKPPGHPAGKSGRHPSASGNIAGNATIPNYLHGVASTQPTVGLKVDAFGQGVDVIGAHPGKPLARGAMLAMDNQVDPTSGTVRVRAAFNNADHKLFPNEFVNVRLLVQVLNNSVLVPDAAVQYGPDSGTFIYVVKPQAAGESGKSPKESSGAGQHSSGQHHGASPTTGASGAQGQDAGIPGVVEIRNVVVGPSQGGFTAIKSGLEPGEVIVTEGVDKLTSGSKVVVHFPAPKPPATQASANSTTHPAAPGAANP